MDQSRSSIEDHLSNAGRHSTTVHETVAPAVTSETVTPTRHERVTTAVDKEIHQDHHHTTIQPVHHKEVLPEQHTHQQEGVEHRTFRHDDSRETERRLQDEAAGFADQRVVGQTQHTQSQQPTIAGEHIHHHVYETVQPVVHKQTVAPEVVHKTIPIKETHHNAAQHHAASALPAVSIDDFKKQGGVLDGRGERQDAFEGEPRSVGGALSGDSSSHNTRTTGATSTSTSNTSGIPSTSGVTGTSGTTGTTGTSSSAYDTYDHASSGTTDTSAKKPGLLDKLNPSKDADGDGKKGFLS